MLLFELTVGLLAFALLLSVVARRLAVPYPSLLVIGGLVLGFIPNAPTIVIDPQLALALFLPPILFDSAYSASWRDLRDNWRPILLLSVGLILITTFAVAAVVHFLVPDMPWAIAIALGAIVAPPDAAAASAVLQRLHIPRRITTIIEAESLLNDATALILYKFAVVAAVTGSFSLGQASVNFVLIAVGSIALGIACGYAQLALTRRLDDAITIILIGFVAVAAVYLIADHLALSGVLTVVAMGVTFFWRAQTISKPETRLAGFPIWDAVVYLLNVLGFVLIGLQLRPILSGLDKSWPLSRLLLLGFAMVATMIVVRILWVMFYNSVVRVKNALHGSDAPAHFMLPTWQGGAVISWAGMRGLVSIVTALALPLTTANGDPFPYRDLLLGLAFAAVFGTLVFQGLTLGPLIRLLGVSDGDSAEREFTLARSEAAKAAIAAIDQLAETPGLPHNALDQVRAEYVARLAAISEAREGVTDDDLRAAIRLAAIAAERDAIIRLRKNGLIGDDAEIELTRDLDLIELSIKRAHGDAAVTWLDTARPAT
ncbi:MAG: Na+/H+ antiporter [Rhodospirillales bacterium]|nr:Na+/H+ antiporter [Rhodospirillales bacterium]